MNYLRFLNAVSLARKPSPIRLLTDIIARSPPSLISLAPGVPNSKLFPFKEAEVKLRDGSSFMLTEEDMKVALQYSPSSGLHSFQEWIKELVRRTHTPPTFNQTDKDSCLDVVISAGSQDAISKSLEMMVSRGDNVLVEEPTYSGTLAILHPLQPNLLPVNSDHDGLVPESLLDALSPWKPEDSKDIRSDIPRVLYLIPNGVNPTGASLTLDRKKRIYEICRLYDIIILEDDPYYYLQYQQPRVPSFLSLDVDGRVIRFDSFSKIMAAGLRVGFVCGPKALTSRLLLHMMSSTLHPGSLSQCMLNSLVCQWGYEKFEDHANSVAEFYRKQKEEMSSAISKHLTGLAEWSDPTAGMFFWLKLNTVPDTKKLIEERAFKKEILFVPGCMFMIDSDRPSPCIRATFSNPTPEQMNTAFKRLAELIKEVVKQH